MSFLNFYFILALIFSSSVFSREISIEQIDTFSICDISQMLWSKVILGKNNNILVCDQYQAYALDNQLNVSTVFRPSQPWEHVLCIEYLKGSAPDLVMAAYNKLYLYDDIGNYKKIIQLDEGDYIYSLSQLTENTFAACTLVPGHLYICDIVSGKFIKIELGCQVSFMLVDENNADKNIIIGLINGTILCFSNTGDLIWKNNTENNYCPQFMKTFDNLLFVGSSTLWSSIDGGSLQVFNIETGEELVPFNFDKNVTYLSKSKNHQKLVSSSGLFPGGQICVWDVLTRQLISSFKFPESYGRAWLSKFVPNSKLLISIIGRNIILSDQFGNIIFLLKLDSLTPYVSIKFITSDTFILVADNMVGKFKINGINRLP